MPSPVPKSPPREPAAEHMPESPLATEAPPPYNVRNADTTTSLAEQLTHSTQASAEVPQQPAAPAAQIEPDPWQRLAQLTADELAPKSARCSNRPRQMPPTDCSHRRRGWSKRTQNPATMQAALNELLSSTGLATSTCALCRKQRPALPTPKRAQPNVRTS